MAQPKEWVKQRYGAIASQAQKGCRSETTGCDGHTIYYRVRDERVFEVIDHMREILADQLAHLEDLAAALGR